MNLRKVNVLNLQDTFKPKSMKTKLLLILVIVSCSFAFGQKKLADKFYKNYAYVKASELYEEAFNDGDDSEHVLTRLGDCYYNNSKPEEAAEWYLRALEKYADINPEYIYKYIQTQRSLGNYETANEWLTKFNTLQSNDSRVNEQIDLSIFNDLKSTENVYVELRNLDLNSSVSDFGSYINNGKLYFASARNSDKIYKWNEEPYLDIFEAKMSKEGSETKIESPGLLTSEDVNTDFHEASVAITKDGKTMYFTRDNVNKRNKLSYDNKGTSYLKIYRATLQNGTWQNIKELPFNDKVFSTGHPTLSADEKQLYFVSDREGGIGQTDIYVVDINDDYSFSEPRNLGPKINTEGREMFPFIAKDSTLYFSSDGYVNLGLLDIFRSDYIKDETAEPQNLGAPYNSGYDDFAFIIDSDTEEGYLSSNRPEGKGSDDIYSFAVYQCKQMIRGVVRNSETQAPIAKARVQKIDETGRVIEEITTDENGSYEFELDCNETYTIVARKIDYKEDFVDIETTDEKDKIYNEDLHLVPLIQDDQIVINPIFFDFDKWNIRTDAQYELENIVDVMRQHPNMIIKIESHTDSRGRDRYNEKLSDRRAKSTRDYLLTRNIAPERIQSAIGYGESQLLNECANGVKCSEEKHQENRRSYFYIVKDDNID